VLLTSGEDDHYKLLHRVVAAVINALVVASLVFITAVIPPPSSGAEFLHPAFNLKGMAADFGLRCRLI
jgi:hypothetical protein